MKITTKEHFISSKQDSSCQSIVIGIAISDFYGNEEMVTYSQIPESGILMAHISDLM